MRILIINGANLNLLSKRKPEIYGNLSLDEMNLKIDEFAKSQGIEVEFFQSNIEGEIINKLQIAQKENFHGVVLNAGAYSHTSLAISDTIEAIGIDVVEVHISNIFSREKIRHKSLISKNCKGIISGFGLKSYILAILSFKNF